MLQAPKTSTAETTGGEKPVLAATGIGHSFSGFDVLEDISFALSRSEILCLLGRSGSGKSTLLRIIAGLLRPQKGVIAINGQDQRAVPTYKRDIGFVFQKPALFPHLTVYDNIAFPFRRGHKLRQDANLKAAVGEMLDLTDLGSVANRSIADLSGGELQRVTLARALVYRPTLLLLDEPLGSLDNFLKPKLLSLIRHLQCTLGTTLVYVTHDEREAIALGTSIAVLIDKRLSQIGPAQEVLQYPRTPRVAELIGGWNVLDATQDCPIYSDLAVLTQSPAECLVVAVPVAATTFSATVPAGNDQLTLPVEVAACSYWYTGTRYECRYRLQRLLAHSATDSQPTDVQGGFVSFRKENIHVFKHAN